MIGWLWVYWKDNISASSQYNKLFLSLKGWRKKKYEHWKVCFFNIEKITLTIRTTKYQVIYTFISHIISLCIYLKTHIYNKLTKSNSSLHYFLSLAPEFHGGIFVSLCVLLSSNSASAFNASKWSFSHKIRWKYIRAWIYFISLSLMSISV